MEETEIQKKVETPLLVSDVSKKYLKEISSWATFFAVLGFIGVGLMALVAIIVVAVVPFIPTDGSDQLAAFPMALIGGLYFALAVLYFFPVLYLFRFASKMKLALMESNVLRVDDAFKNMKSHFKFMGIMTIVIFSLYVLAAIAVVVMGGLTNLMMC